jgi:hypothetical protein
MQVNRPETFETMLHGYEQMLIAALQQAPSGQVNCNSCGMIHPFYQCPSLEGMDVEAQKVYFRARAMEKNNAKKVQYQVNQVYVEDDQDDQDDTDNYSAANTDMTNWTKEDWIDFQRGSFVPSPPNFQ